MAESITLNSIFYLNLLITDSNGIPKPGLSASYIIYKSNDDSVIASGVLTDVGTGIYKASYTCTALGQFYVIYTTPTGYTDETESFFVQNETAKANELARVLGLSDENKKILNTVHDSNGSLTSATVKLFPTATDFENNTNVLAEYEYSATYNASGLMQTMGIKRIP